jgi:ABC-type multidrug transport system ATPase subunit
MNIAIRDKRIKGKSIIRDINVSLNKGEMMLVLAPSGCGKTTLIKCILGETFYDGSVKCQGKRKVAYVSQESTVNDKETVYNAVYYTARMDDKRTSGAELRKKTEAMLQELGLCGVQKQAIRDISGGQRRRLQIAEAMVRDSDVLLMDEPDSGLDAATSYILTKDVKKIVKKEGKKAIIISHNITKENLKLYDVILCMSKDENNVGTMAYYGRPCFLKEFFEQSSMLDIMLDLQTKSEGGRGFGNYYIQRYKELSDTRKQHYRFDGR